MVAVARGAKSSYRVYHHETRNRFDRALVILLMLLATYLVYDKNTCPPCDAASRRNSVESHSLLLNHVRQQEEEEEEPEGDVQEDESLPSYPSGTIVQKKHQKKSQSSSSSSSSHGSGGGYHSSSSKNKKSVGSKQSSNGKSSQGASKSSSGQSQSTKSDGSSSSSAVSTSSRQQSKFIKQGSKWKNKYDVVHIVTTRYMQLQPDLMDLGKARNDLMRVFALPGFVQQTTQEYIWIIFTDPNLAPELLNEVVDMIQPYPNILLLGMNNGMNNFKAPDWMKHIQHVFSGDMDLLQDYRQAAKHRVLLETRLDADDSIFVEMMDAVQKQAADTLGIRAMAANYDPTQLEKEYRILCTEHHLEWGYFNPWDKSSVKGHLFGIHKPEWCVSAGLTHVFQVGTVKDDLPTTSHHKMNENIPQCGTTKTEILQARNCIERINAKNYKYIMMRSRTPTSAGMLGVIPKKEVIESDTWKHKQDLTWETVIPRNFGIQPQSIYDLRERLKGNMENILKDALKGQCTKAEFTCKDETKRDLNNLLQAVKDNS